MKSVRRLLLAFWCSLVLALTPVAFAQSESSAEGVGEATKAVQPEVQTEANIQTEERRKKILQEAIDALARTKDALSALEEERVDDALEALAVATGKLELIVARDPELALAATDVSITTHDLFASTEAIKTALKSAEKALDKGAVQEARRILDAMGSELVITVTNLPLATYPDAIKAITPLIDAGKIEAAKRGLQAALNTLVLTHHVVPLPVVRSEALLEQAEELAKKSDRSDDEYRQLANQLAAVREQLEMAQLLGYGRKNDYEQLYAQLDQIEAQTADGESGAGFFDKLEKSMARLMD